MCIAGEEKRLGICYAFFVGSIYCGSGKRSHIGFSGANVNQRLYIERVKKVYYFHPFGCLRVLDAR